MREKTKLIQTLILTVLVSFAVYFLYDNYDLKFSFSSVLGSDVNILQNENSELSSFNAKYNITPAKMNQAILDGKFSEAVEEDGVIKIYLSKEK